MSTRSQSSGRTALVLPLVAVAALAAVFLVANPFGGGDDLDRASEGGNPEDLLDARGAEDPKTLDPASAGLSGRFAEGDLGEVRLRLLDVAGSVPLVGQSLLLAARRGAEATAVSGEDGVALFTRLAPGRGYRLEISIEDHAPVTIQGVRVEAGKTTDLGDVLVGRNVVIRGRVIDGSGQPIAGTSVAVYTPARSMAAEGFLVSMVEQATSFPAPLEQVETDAEGWFTLQSLTDGTYRLEARRSGYATRLEPSVIVAQDRPARAMTIVLGEGATMTGRVRDEAGRPVTGGRVVAIKDSGQRFFTSSTVERDVAYTDAGGQYVMDTLMQGQSYRFGVIAEGYAPVFETSGTELQTKRQTKDFDLVRGGSLRGRVVREGDGEPLQDAQVIVAVGRMMGRRGGGSGDGNDRAATGTARTDENGEFVIQNIHPGPVMTGQVRLSGYVAHNASMWMGGQGWSDVVPGEETDVGTVELVKGGIVEGVISDAATGQPLPRAEVTIVPRQQMWRIFMSGAPNTVADADGKFQLIGVAAGEYGVVAVADGYAPSDPQSDGTEVTMPETVGSVSRNVAITRAGSVKGVVTDSQGEPVAGARVRTRMAPRERGEGGRGRGRGRGRMMSFLPGGSSADLTDQNGRFRIDGVSSDERWILVADADEFVEIESEPFRVTAGESKEVNLTLMGGGNLAGRVIDDRGSPVVGARVRVGHLPADRAGRGRLNAWEVDRYLEPRVYFSDEDGKFLAEDIPPGIAVVKAEKEDHVTFYKRNAMIRSDETSENYTITLSKGDVLEGVVKSASGQVVEGAVVAVTKNDNPGGEEEQDPNAEPDENIEPRLSARSDKDGKFRIENVPPGTYNLVVWFAPGYRGWARERNESAMRRGVASSSKSVEFRLEQAEAGGGAMGGGGRSGRGGR